MTEKELIKRTNEAISELVYSKHELQKAYNYYNGKRDPELYRYLEENFGIGSPTSVTFTPLLKKHVDALVGEFLGTPILPKISCKDNNTISNITREKQLAVTEGIINFLKSHLNNSLLQIVQGKDITDKAIKQQLDKVIQDVDLSFISKYEIAALNILLYIMQSRHTDLITKLRLIFTDLLITGYTFYRIKESPSGTNIEIEVLNPLNTFVDRNPESPYVKDSYRVVIRNWLTKSLILAKYGKELSKEDLASLKERWRDDEISNYKRVWGPETVVFEETRNEVEPGYPEEDYGSRHFRLIPVYEVEWIETDKDFVMQRYNSIRISNDIYILRGIDKNVIRTQDNYNYCGLSVNGVYFLNRSLQPYSLILRCAHLQDRYDLLNYYRDVLVANSGVKGSIIDVSLLPTILGKDFETRLSKCAAYRKQGSLLIDSSQEGRNDNGNGPMNTIFNGFDDSLPANAIQALDLAIQSVENTVSSITGVFRERLNGIEQRDAVSNIKQGVTNSYTVTKHYYQLMDLITCELLLDCLNLAKKTYKNGLTGTLILGDVQQQVFTALPENYTITDFDIHIISSTEVMLDMLTIKLIVPEFLKSQLMPAEVIIEAMTSKSLSDLKQKVKKALKVQKEENNQLQQLNLKLEETQQLALQMQQLLQQALKKIESLNESKLQLEQQKMQLQYKVDWFNAQTNKELGDRKLDIENDRTKIELALLHDGNPYNDKIRDL